MRRTTTCLSFQKPVYETVCLVSWSQFSDFLYDSSMVSRTMEIRIQLVVERYVDFYSRRFYPGHAGLQFLFFYPPIRGMNGWMDENGAGLVSNVSASLKDDSSVLGERKKRTFVGESRSLERRRLIGSELIWRILRPIWDKLLVFRESKFENGPRGKLECAKERKRNAIKLFSPTLSFHSIQRCERETGI